LICLAFTLGASPVSAAAEDSGPCVKTHKVHHVRQKSSSVKKAAKKSPAKTQKGNADVRSAQEHLAHLGYYKGKIDGIMGPKTRAAIKKFQREHGLKGDGILGKKTKRALEDADRILAPAVIIPPERLPMPQAVIPSDTEVNQDYASPLNGIKIIDTRFGRLEVSESADGTNGRLYNVSLNGQPILAAGGQPSVIGIQRFTIWATRTRSYLRHTTGTIPYAPIRITFWCLMTRAVNCSPSRTARANIGLR